MSAEPQRNFLLGDIGWELTDPLGSSTYYRDRAEVQAVAETLDSAEVSKFTVQRVWDAGETYHYTKEKGWNA